MSADATDNTATPAADVDVDAALVTRLLAAEHPDLATLDLESLEAGWDNAMFRLGADLVVRLPRRAAAASLIVHEQRWLGALAGRLPLAVPAPCRIGHPGPDYPWPWSVLPWLPGRPADTDPVAADQGPVLAEFLQALHTTPPADAPVNPFRGVPLADRADIVGARLERLAPHLEALGVAATVRAAWHRAMSAPARFDATWVHGDLHERNVLVSRGMILGVIDWGDLCAGDPATDLAAVWLLLDDPGARHRAISHYGPGEPGLWFRALGWAVSFGAVLLETGLADHPRHARMGERIFRRIAVGPDLHALPG